DVRRRGTVVVAGRTGVAPAARHAHEGVMRMDREWRVEADDEWLATHRSDVLGRLRRRFRALSGLAGAVSEAEMGPYGGAPRRPRLRIGGRAYAYVRYTTQHIAYTSIRVDPDRCRRCGQELVEAYRIGYAQGDSV